MNLYLIVPTPPTDNAEKLADAIQQRFGSHAYRLPGGEWLIAYPETSKALSDELGISDGSNGSGIVAGISGYFGFAPSDIWEWMRVMSQLPPLLYLPCNLARRA